MGDTGTLVSIVLLAPFVAACGCFLVSLWFALRMFQHVRAERRWLAFFAGPAVLASESFFTAEGIRYFRSFRRWFGLFAFFLVGWGLLALLVYGGLSLWSDRAL